METSSAPEAGVVSVNELLRAIVEEKLELKWSPEQIARWRNAYLSEEMRISHETIYLSLL